MKKTIFILLLNISLVAFVNPTYCQSFASVTFVSAEFIEDSSLYTDSEYVSGHMKLTFDEYDCSPECRPLDEKLILLYPCDLGEGIFPFFRKGLEINSSYSKEFIFQIWFEDNIFLGISY